MRSLNQVMQESDVFERNGALRHQSHVDAMIAIIMLHVLPPRLVALLTFCSSSSPLYPPFQDPPALYDRPHLIESARE
jgi:hypothetical protein